MIDQIITPSRRSFVAGLAAASAASAVPDLALAQ